MRGCKSTSGHIIITAKSEGAFLSARYGPFAAFQLASVNFLGGYDGDLTEKLEVKYLIWMKER